MKMNLMSRVGLVAVLVLVYLLSGCGGAALSGAAGSQSSGNSQESNGVANQEGNLDQVTANVSESTTEASSLSCQCVGPDYACTSGYVIHNDPDCIQQATIDPAVATVQAGATKTAQAVNSQLTGTPTSENMPIGYGHVRILAPSSIQIGKSAQLKVEIEIVSSALDSAQILALPTQLVSTVNDEPLEIEIYEVMEVKLGGVDLAHFNVDAISTSGLRQIQTDKVNRWVWEIEPVDTTVGIQNLELRIYFPNQVIQESQFDHTLLLATPLEVQIVEPTVSPQVRQCNSSFVAFLNCLLGGFGKELGAGVINFGILSQTIVSILGILTIVMPFSLWFFKSSRNRWSNKLARMYEGDQVERIEAVERTIEYIKGKDTRKSAKAKDILADQGKNNSEREVKRRVQAYQLIAELNDDIEKHFDVDHPSHTRLITLEKMIEKYKAFNSEYGEDSNLRAVFIEVMKLIYSIDKNEQIRRKTKAVIRQYSLDR